MLLLLLRYMTTMIWISCHIAQARLYPNAHITEPGPTAGWQNMQIFKMSCGLWWCKAITKSAIPSEDSTDTVNPFQSPLQNSLSKSHYCDVRDCSDSKGLLNSWVLWQGQSLILCDAGWPWVPWKLPLNKKCISIIRHIYDKSLCIFTALCV